MNNAKLLDQTGWKILEELQRDARINFKELGRKVSLSAPAVTERVRRMEEAGIITGYRIEVDAEKVGLGLTAFIRVQAPGANHKRVEELVRELPEVLECHRITGDDCFLMKAVVSSMEHLQRILDRLVVYGSPVTSIVISSPVEARSPGKEASPLYVRNPRTERGATPEGRSV